MKQNNRYRNFAAALAFAACTGLAPAAVAQTADKPFTFVEQMPEFEGGSPEMLKFLGQNIRYPEDAKKNGLEGLVVVEFVVDADGSVKDVRTVKSLSSSTDTEAIRVIRQMDGKWRPGRQNGKVVAVRYVLPIRFALTEADKRATADAANKAPQYKGGQQAMMQAIGRHLQLPEEAKQQNLNARVVVKFKVETDGSVSDIRLEQPKFKKVVGPGAEFDYMDASSFNIQSKTLLAKLSEAAAAAVRATSGQWEPAMHSGKPVAAELVLPVQFLGSEGSDAAAQEIPKPVMQPLTTEKEGKNFYTAEEVDVKPRFKQGSLQEFVTQNLRRPASSTFEGNVAATLFIKQDGKIVMMMQAAGNAAEKDLFEEIARVLKLTGGNWIPAKHNGRYVSYVQHLTLQFRNDASTKLKEPIKVNSSDMVILLKK